MQYGFGVNSDPLNTSSRGNVKLNSLNRSEISVNQKIVRNKLENQADYSGESKKTNKLSNS